MTDKLAFNSLDTKVWISKHSTISRAEIVELLQTESEKDLPDMRSDRVELT